MIPYLALLLTVPVSAAEWRGHVTDESRAIIPGARVAIAGPAKRTTVTNNQGEYRFDNLPAGRYSVVASAEQMAMAAPLFVNVSAQPVSLDIELKVSSANQSVTVEEVAANAIAADTRNNPGALVLRGEDLDVLSDKPEDLAADLMALAGPSAGPSGGAIFVDGFSGGQLPSKDAIREIRINQNPFAPENDRVGFGTIEVFTKPGSEKFKGALYYNFANSALNTRNPYAGVKAPFNLHEFGGNFGGPLGKTSSFFVDVRRDDIANGAVINGSVLDRLTLAVVNPYTDVLRIPQQRLSVSPRADWQLGAKHTLTARYTYLEAGVTNSGVGSFNLPERGLRAASTANTAQFSDTWIPNANTVNETRVQFFRLAANNTPNTAGPALQVLGAFQGGGAPLGISGDTRNSFEVQNYTSLNRGRHTVRFGTRLRGEFADTLVRTNFNGTFTFGGNALGLSSIEQYRRTLAGLPGGGATQFTLTAGQPSLSANQVDVGLFLGDDFRLRQNLTLGYGLRYERQSNLSDGTNLAPRLALAWAPGGGGKTKAKSVLRVATGLFYDRFGLANTLNAARYNGVVQQQYVISNPDFFPSLPTPTQLAAARTTQIIQTISPGLRALRLWQTAAGYDRELRKGTTLSLTYAFAHGDRLLRSRAFAGPVFQAQSTGDYRQHQWITSVNSRLNAKVSLFGSYVLNRARSNTDGIGTFPANPSTDVGEYGPAATDIRQRGTFGGTIVAPWGVRLNPLLTAESGPPYDITVGRDLYGNTLFNGRPALAAAGSKPGLIQTRYGFFDPNPAPGVATIGRNYGRGPGSILLNLRLSRTFAFGIGEGREAPTNIPGGGERRADASGVFATGTGTAAGGARTSRKYNITVGLSIRNLLNRNNPGPIIGNLTSPIFGQANQAAGSAVPLGTTFSESANNRRLELQMRFTF
ncbi:MAG: carboxypeptidase regulatory-like domain-containing protein [Bryobacteraceae bacterium]|nr:carboxypeptidase regulatory-like domain-containing protein [Bryobacteraceae bacterium]